MERDEGNRSPAQVREPSGELLGPYTLLTELARGELTTVHLAKKRGPLGFQRLLTIKRLRPEYAGQENYIKLLVDEAQLTAGLHHANLVGVLDVGSEGGCYVVSDYIEGENLERVLVRVGAMAQPRFVLPLLVDALSGLHAVHHAFGDDEQPLRIVHQAPCARHILVGVDGVGRLTDFSQMSARGIEPSRTRSERLRVAYMAPEQALDPEHVDHRADLFIVGITLWEALTGEHLFAADTEERTFQNLLHRRIPRPSEVGACPPRSLDAVCMRALERDPAARFSSAHEMARELRDAALNQALFASPGEIGAWVTSVMGRELIERRRKSGDLASEFALPGARTHGFLDPRQEDPYLSGRIHGGSSGDTDGSSDPDKTPVHAKRDRLGLFPIQRDDEPTAPRFLAFHSMNEVPRPPRRVRVSTPPYGAFSDGAAGTDSHASAVIEKSSFESAEAEAAAFGASAAADALESIIDTARTTPNRVSAAPQGPAGGTPPPRPGAYSQIDPSARSKRVSRQPKPESPGKTQPARELNMFDEVDTGRYAGITSLPPPAPQAARPSYMPSKPPAARSTLPPPLPRKSSPVIETEPVSAVRRDSIPARLSIPPEPVGAPLASRPTPSAEALPKTFEAIRASEASESAASRPSTRREAPFVATPGDSGPGTSLVSISSSVALAPSSLTPPNTAERTLPPQADLDDDARPRGNARWWAMAAAAAIVVAFIGANVRQSVGRSRSTAASPSTLQVDSMSPDTAKALEKQELQQGPARTEARDVAPQLEPATGARSASAPATAAHSAGAASSKPARKAPTVLPAPSVAEGTTAAAQADQAAERAKLRRDVRPKSEGSEAPPAANPKPKVSSALRSAIPDNPY
ncbi:MAG: protein kinase [Myxococcales bacterium]